MIERIKQYWVKFIAFLMPEEVQPLSASNAQALSYYRKPLNYDEMVKRLRSKIFSDIRDMSKFSHDYIIVDIPTWLKQSTYEALIKELVGLEYCTREVTELSLLIIYWNSNK